jgi:hypothetical protein
VQDSKLPARRSMGEPRDLQYIGSVLQGAPGTSGARAQSPSERRLDRETGRGGHRRGSGAAARSSSRSRVRADQPGAAATSSQHPYGAHPWPNATILDANQLHGLPPAGQNMLRHPVITTPFSAACPAGGGASAGSSPAGASRSSGAAAADAGGPGSASRGHRRCELCDCLVLGGEAGWRMHAAGIQHRRQVGLLTSQSCAVCRPEVLQTLASCRRRAPACTRPAAAGSSAIPSTVLQSIVCRRCCL